MSPDPYAASGGPTNPGSWNRYAYGGGDPINHNDPSGLYEGCPGGTTVTNTDFGQECAPVDDSTGSISAFCASASSTGMITPDYYLYCDGSLPLTQTGSGSGDSGGVSPQLDALSAGFLALQSQLNNLSQDCMDNVVGKLASALPGFSLSGFENYLSEGVRLFDGPTSLAGPADFAGLAGVASLAQYCGATDVGEAFACKGRNGTTQINDLTSTAGGQLTIWFRASSVDLSNGGVNANNESVLFHEALHGYGGGDYTDTDIQLALFGKDSLLRRIFGGRRIGAASDNITQYIKKHCF